MDGETRIVFVRQKYENGNQVNPYQGYCPNCNHAIDMELPLLIEGKRYIAEVRSCYLYDWKKSNERCIVEDIQHIFGRKIINGSIAEKIIYKRLKIEWFGSDIIIPKVDWSQIPIVTQSARINYYLLRDVLRHLPKPIRCFWCNWPVDINGKYYCTFDPYKTVRCCSLECRELTFELAEKHNELFKEKQRSINVAKLQLKAIRSFLKTGDPEVFKKLPREARKNISLKSLNKLRTQHDQKS